MSIPVVDWNDNEQVVRAVRPECFIQMFYSNPATYIVSGGFAYTGGNFATPEEAWAYTRQHPSVQAYEAIHSPAKRLAEKVQDGGFEAWWSWQDTESLEPGMVYARAKYHSRAAWDAALASHAECVDCRDYENNIRTWIEQLGGNPGAVYISTELERLISTLASHAQGETVTWRVDWHSFGSGTYPRYRDSEKSARAAFDGETLGRFDKVTLVRISTTTTETVVAERKAGAQ